MADVVHARAVSKAPGTPRRIRSRLDNIVNSFKRRWSERNFSPAPSVLIPYLTVKYQDLAPTLPAASLATILTVFLPFESLGDL